MAAPGSDSVQLPRARVRRNRFADMTLSADQCGGSAGRIKCRAANINDAVSVWRKWWNANFWQKKKTVEEKEEEEEKAGSISNERRGDRFGGGSPFLGLLKHFKEGRVCVHMSY